MNDAKNNKAARPVWFVSSRWNESRIKNAEVSKAIEKYGGHNQTERFLENGIWENSYDDKYTDLVRQMQPGDRIAIQSKNPKGKRAIPFEYNGKSVHVTTIWAIGKITKNMDDGKQIKVEWQKQPENRKWYFHASICPNPVNKVPSNHSASWLKKWMTDDLIAFTFEGKPQDIKRFCEDPDWQERFGTTPSARSKSAKESWKNPEVRKARTARSGVEVSYKKDGEIFTESHSSMKEAFDALGLPDSQHRKVRKECKQVGKAKRKYNEVEYNFRDIPKSKKKKPLPEPPRNEIKNTDDSTMYSVADILEDGCFLEESEIKSLLERLKAKKNLILQGPPGTGKTWLAKRLAWALTEQKDSKNIRAVQFHQSYSYEDFVGGFRPSVKGKRLIFEAKDGAFLRLCDDARDDPNGNYVMLIDEINRGNLSRVFGELLMLIEADKRDPSHAIELQHKTHNEGSDSEPAAEKFYVPSNIHIIGTMNLADRSLTGMNIAMRRRFAFFELEPQFDKPRFRDWLSKTNMPSGLQKLIHDKMTALNDTIHGDLSLGENYAIGHSFFCPDSAGDEERASWQEEDWEAWHSAIVEQEIRPLLKEYWFDNPAKAKEEADKLLEDD